MRLKDIIRDRLGAAFSGGSLLDQPGSDVAVASIMVLVARSDGGVSLDEGIRIQELLKDRFGLTSHDAQTLILRVSDRMQKGGDHASKLIGTLSREISTSDKEELMLLVLEVIAADNRKDTAELELLARLVDDLEVPDAAMDRAYARYFREEN